MSAPPPPIEWVEGPRLWWVYRLLLPFGGLGIAVGLEAYYLSISWHFLACMCGASPGVFPGFQVVILAVISLGLGSQAIYYLVPSTRRIGIAPTGLLVDVGLRRFDYGWGQVCKVTRTRLSVVPGGSYRLSVQQGERLARLYALP